MSEPTPASRWGAFDGLRAIAVYLVVAFHAGLGRFDGGYVGVDVFFVLSGFLITRLLVAEHDRDGHIDLLGFYARRARRLLPAAWLAILATCAMYVLVATPFERETVLRDARASVLYVANWNFIARGSDYFAESIQSSPFLHLWSLAVEEQFYVVWPLCVLGVLAMRRRSPTLAAGSVAALAVVGAAYALWMADRDLIRAYYGTDTRAYQLLLGAAIALIASSGSARRLGAISTTATDTAVVVGLAGIVGVATVVEASPVARGVLAATATAFVIVGVIAGRPGDAGLAERALAVRPMVWLGQRSYATYLWHWPFVVVLQRTFEIGPVLTAVIVTLAATTVAHVSMDLIERPVRARSRRAGRREDAITTFGAIGGTLAMAVVAVTVILRVDVAPLEAASRTGFAPVEGGPTAAIAPVGTGSPDVPSNDRTPATTTVSQPRTASSTVSGPDTTVVPAESTETILSSGSAEANPPVVPPTVAPRTEPLEPVPVPDDLGAVELVGEYSEQSGCRNVVPASIDDCVLTTGPGERVLLIGDSHAARLKVAFGEHAAATGGTFAAVTMNGCPWQDGLLFVDALPVEAAKQFCRDQRDLLYDDLLDAYAPDVVVVAGHDQTTEGYEVEVRPDRLPDVSATGVELIEAASRSSIARLAAPGRRIVIVEPLPNAPFHPISCLSAADEIDECSFAVDRWPHLETGMLRRLAGARDDVSTVDMSTLACPHFPTCRPIVDGMQVRTDADHLAEPWVQHIGPHLIRLIGLAT